MPREPQTKAAAGSGRPATTIAVILFVVCTVLAVAFFQRSRRTQDQAESAARIQQSLSNQVAELRTRLALEHGTSAFNQSNQQQLLERRASELFASSNRLSRAQLALSNAEHEATSSQLNSQARAAALANLEAQRDEMLRSLEWLPTLRLELERANQALAQSLWENAALSQMLGSLRVEVAELNRKMDDAAFLRIQARKAEDNAAVRKRMASAKRINPSDPRLQLELQPDGTVRVLSPTNAPRTETGME